jgi:hypothetical protein
VHFLMFYRKGDQYICSVLQLIHAGKSDASASGGDSSNRISQNHGEPKSSDPMYVPGNLTYWRDVRASFVIPKLVRLSFELGCSNCRSKLSS